MTNFEKYKDEILKIIANSDYEMVAVKNGAPVPCDDIECDDCDIRDKSGNGACVSDLTMWLYEDDGADCSPDVSKPKGGCEGCHYEGNNILNLPCCHCERAIIDCFEPKKKPEKKQERKTKTRQDEFLEHYPNAKVRRIQPCSIEDKNFISGRCDRYDDCLDCTDVYWKQEVK